jgi:hypothetical protein
MPFLSSLVATPDTCGSFVATISLNFLFDFCTMVMMLVCAFTSLSIFFKSSEAKEAPFSSKVLLFVLFALVLGMVPMTLRKVTQRWMKTQSKAKVEV